MGALLVLGGAAAGFVNAMAGGGSALTVPLLVYAGLDPLTANGTNRVGVWVQSISATLTFQRRGLMQWSALWYILPPVILGATAGALAAASMQPKAIKLAFGVLFVALAVLMVAKPSWLVPQLPQGVEARKPPHWGLAAMAAVGVYGGMFQAGVGIPLLLVLVQALRVDVVTANALKAALVMVYTLVVLVIFGGHSQIDWPSGLLLAAGGWVGSMLGARAAIAKGAALIRWAVMAVLLYSAVRFLFD